MKHSSLDQLDKIDGFVAKAHEILNEIKYKDWTFLITCEKEQIILRVSFHGPCSKTGQHVEWKGRKWLLSRYMTKSELVQTAFKAVQTAEEHETRETFLYKGRAIFGPHYDVDMLWEKATVEHEDIRS